MWHLSFYCWGRFPGHCHRWYGLVLKFLLPELLFRSLSPVARIGIQVLFLPELIYRSLSPMVRFGIQVFIAGVGFRSLLSMVRVGVFFAGVDIFIYSHRRYDLVFKCLFFGLMFRSLSPMVRFGI